MILFPVFQSKNRKALIWGGQENVDLLSTNFCQTLLIFHANWFAVNRFRTAYFRGAAVSSVILVMFFSCSFC